MRVDFFADLYGALSSVPEQRIFLFMAGKRLGKRHADAIAKSEDVAPLKDFFRQESLGKLEAKSLDAKNGRFTFVLEDSPFKTALKRPCCNVASGLLAGYVEGVYKRYAGAKETRCVSQGDSHCEFDVQVIGKDIIA